jgi:adenylate cyclase
MANIVGISTARIFNERTLSFDNVNSHFLSNLGKYIQSPPFAALPPKKPQGCGKQSVRKSVVHCSKPQKMRYVYRFRNRGDLETTKTRCLMFADIVESVRIVEQGGVGAADRLGEFLTQMSQHASSQYGAEVIERRGDGLFLSFPSARKASDCAFALHKLCDEASQGLSPEDQLALRIGVHQAVFQKESENVYGHHSNLVARLAAIAQPGHSVFSAEARADLTDDLDANIRDLGECYLKHLEQPHRAYALRPPEKSVIQRATAPDPRVGLAVLPFAFGGAEASQIQIANLTVFSVCDVITDLLTNLLSRSNQIRVISRLSANAFRGRAVEGSVISEKLGIEYWLTGHVQRTPSKQLRIYAQLVNGRSNQVVWEHQYLTSELEATIADSPSLSNIAQEVSSNLIDTELRAGRVRPLPNVASHTLLLGAVALMHRFSFSDFEKARKMLEELVERIPRHPMPMAWLARWYVLLIVQKWTRDPKRDAALAVQWANRALDVDPESSLALTVAGSVSIGVKQNIEEAQGLYDRAIEINPNESLAWLLKSVALSFRGYGREAEAASEYAIRLTPLDPLRFYYDSLSGTAALGTQNYELVKMRCQNAIRANSMHGSAYRVLAIAQWMTGETDPARATIDQLLSVEPGSTVAQFQERAVIDNELNIIHANALRNAGLPAGQRNSIL